MLSKQNYLQVNSATFSNQKLTKQQKDQKYIDYMNRFKQRMTRDKTLALSPRGNSNRQMVLYKPPLQNRAIRQGQPKQSKIKFSDCLLRYAQAAIDPFANIMDLPCIPDTISAPSYKFKTFIDVDMTIGTQGVGFAVMNPWSMCVNNNLATLGDADQSIIISTATYGSNQYNWGGGDIGTGAVFAYNSNSPYTYALISVNGASIRLVAAGLQAEYTGQLLNQSGVVSTIQWDGCRKIPFGTIGAIRSNQRTQSCANARENRCYSRYEPTSSEHFNYDSINAHLPSQNPDLEPYYYPLGIIVSGATPGISFRIRAVAFFEAQLSNAPVTPSESDPIGFAAFQSARTAHLPTAEPKSDLLSILKQTAKNIGHTITGFAPEIGTALGSVFGAPALGFAAGSATKNILETLFG